MAVLGRAGCGQSRSAAVSSAAVPPAAIGMAERRGGCRAAGRAVWEPCADRRTAEQSICGRAESAFSELTTYPFAACSVIRYSYIRCSGWRHSRRGGEMSNSQAGLTPAMFNVLLALADGDKHGYAILKEAGAHSDGAVQLSTGTLYGIIKRLLEEGLIVEVRGRQDPDG